MNTELVLLGAVGGALTDLLRMARLARMSQLPRPEELPSVIISIALNGALGSFAAWIAASDTRLAAIATGFGAPEFLARLLGPVKTADEGTEPGPGGQRPGLRRYLSV